MVIGSSLRLFAAGCLVVGVATVGGLAQAQSAPSGAMPTPVIGIVDVDQIYTSSLAAKSLNSQAEKYDKEFQQEMSKQESSLRSIQQELEQQRKTTSPEALAEKARAFDQKLGEFQREAQQRRRAFDKSLAVARNQVQGALQEAARTIAAERGITMVMPSTQVLLFDEKMNITKDVIESMNKSVSKVEFTAPKVDSDGVSAPSSKKPQQ